MSIRTSSRKSRTILTQKKDFMVDGEKTNQTKQESGDASKKVAKYKKPAYLNSLNEAEKAENFKIIDNMNKRVNFLRNPRFKTNKAPISLIERPTGAVGDKVSPFVIEPTSIMFVDYQINGVYEIPLKITNKSSISRRFKYLPPTAQHNGVN